jgi:predicted transposase/invertase (TIGR01784 family)
MPGLSFHQYNLRAVSDKTAQKYPNSKLFQWLDLLSHSSEKRLNEVKYLERSNPKIWKAYEMFIHLPQPVSTKSAEEITIYPFTKEQQGTFQQIGLEQGFIEGLEVGREKGIEKGIEKGLEIGREERKKMISNMFSQGLDLNIIRLITGLSEEEIQALQSSNNN